MTPPDLLNASNYRSYVSTFIAYQGATDRRKSLRYYSLKMEASESYLRLVLSGKRTLSADYALKLARAFKLDPLAKRYFVTLVLRDDCDSPATRTFFNRDLASQRTTLLQYDATARMPSVFRDSLLWEIYSLVGVEGFRAEATWILQRLTLRNLTIARIEHALKTLFTLGIVVKEVTASGEPRFFAKDSVLRDSALLSDAYRSSLQRAIEHVEQRDSLSTDYFDSFCLILSEEEFSEIQTILAETKARIAQLVKRKGPKSRIAYYNANLFWASRP